LSGQTIEPLGVLKGVWSSDGNRFYISGSGGAAYRTIPGSTQFESLDTRVNEPLRGLWGSNGSVYAVGLDGLILRYSGGMWRRVRSQGADELPAAFFFDIDGASEDD